MTTEATHFDLRAAAIATWTTSWPAILDQIRTTTSDAAWTADAELIRVLQIPPNFAAAVHGHFCRRRGSNVFFSPLDWLLLECWAEAGFSSVAIMRAIDEVFDRNDRGRQFDPARQVNSLNFCKPTVFRQAMNEASVKTGLLPRDTGKSRWTLLIALPPRGRTIFAAMHTRPQVDRASREFQIGIAFTVYPDQWHRAEALKRFGIDLPGGPKR